MRELIHNLSFQQIKSEILTSCRYLYFLKCVDGFEYKQISWLLTISDKARIHISGVCLFTDQYNINFIF